MKIGIIGLGSIGQRHVGCLQKLGITNIFALRTKKGTNKELPGDLEHVKEISIREDFYNLNLDGIIISNPTSLHVDSMIEPLNKKIPIFIEKPIADSLNSVNELVNYDISKIMVGYCLRYHSLINEVKTFINSGKLGNIYKARLYCGHYLPFWHPYADYRTEYYSRKDLGGGALRTLSHEIDLMYYLFGEVKDLLASMDKISDLEIDVEDNVHILCKTHSDSIIHIELDYLNPIYQRKGTIFGTNGKLEYSFSDIKLLYSDLDGSTKVIYENQNLDPNRMYLDQMQGFLNLIKHQKPGLCSFNDGIYVMKIIEVAEEASRLKSWQKVDQG